jgi:hypothetical protein
MNQSNPLAKHFRQPAIFLKLPSQGQYWPENALTLSATGELPVYPMTTKDEITLRTPDALINGTAIVNVIQSCIPSIADPWVMPSVDVDACLIAIRIASYGTDMDLSTTCPNCNHINDHTINLPSALEQIAMPNFDSLIKEPNLTIKLKPQTYFAVNRANSATYKEQRILDVLNQPDTEISDEDREKNLKIVTDDLIELNMDNLTDSTEYILMSDGTRVTDREFIKEFYANTSGLLIRKVQEKLGEIATSAGLKPYNNVCTECQHEYKTEVTFDYANFFGLGS